MKTEQVNLRLEAELIAAVEQAAQEESLDRGTMIRKLLMRALSGRKVDRAFEQYQLGEVSIGRATEDAGLTHWEFIELARKRGIAYPLDLAEAEARLTDFLKQPPLVAERTREYRSPLGKTAKGGDTLPDRPPRPGGVLLIGINPAPVSVKAGHYYQGRLGKRMWRKLALVGLLADPVPGAEDDAFVGAGHGLTDLVKRPTRSASELSHEEKRSGLETLKRKIRAWQPGLIVFPFKEIARGVTGVSSLAPGQGPPFEGVPTFLLSGPYAAREISGRVEDELRSLLSASPTSAPEGAMTQTITAKDIETGIIRLPRDAKRYFNQSRGPVTIVLRGVRLEVRYDPMLGPPVKSGVLRIGRDALAKLVKPGERLRISRTAAGGITLA